MSAVVAALFAMSASAQSGATPKPEISLTLIPPSPVTDQITLDIRGAVREQRADTTKEFEVAVYLDQETPGKHLHRESIEVAPKSAAGVRFRWPTKDQAGKRKILLVAISGAEIRRAVKPMEILRSDVRSTRRVDGAWCSFNLPEMSEGKLYDPDLRRMTSDQWREMVRGCTRSAWISS